VPRQALPRTLLLGFFLTAGMAVPITGTGVAEACAEGLGPGAVFLAGFEGGPEAASPFYAAAEGTDARATIRISPGDCMWPRATAQYASANGSAVAPEDYEARSGTTSLLCDDVHGPPLGSCDGVPPEHEVLIPTETGKAERAVETFMFNLTGGSIGVEPPSSAPVHVVDADEAPRAALEPTVDGTGVVAYSRSETFARIRVPVFAAGSPLPASVGYSIDPATENPATPGEDFEVLSSNPLPIPSSRVGFIDIRLINDQLGEGPESAAITLTGAVDGPTSTTFTIEDNEESERPRSRFHHPRHTWRYKKSDYRIREFHVFTKDNPGGSGVVASQLALKRTRKNGTCQWLTKSGWQRKDCQNRTWLDMRYDPTGELFLYRMKQLKSSVKTKIKNYSAFSRAIDGAENIENDFKEKRNANTFEIKRTRKRRGR
jgi:hypothetical protein